MGNLFWFIAGTLTGLSAMLIAFPLLRAARAALDKRILRITATAIGIAGFAAAALLLYPRYIDPVTGLPCPAEVVVDRLAKSAATQQGLVVSMRRLQGKVMRGLRALAR